jgi:hypothetical protein
MTREISTNQGFPNYHGYEIQLSTRRTRTGFEGAYVVCKPRTDRVVFSGVTASNFTKAATAEASAFLAAKECIDDLLAGKRAKQPGR